MSDTEIVKYFHNLEKQSKIRAQSDESYTPPVKQARNMIIIIISNQLQRKRKLPDRMKKVSEKQERTRKNTSVQNINNS